MSFVSLSESEDDELEDELDEELESEEDLEESEEELLLEVEVDELSEEDDDEEDVSESESEELLTFLALPREGIASEIADTADVSWFAPASNMWLIVGLIELRIEECSVFCFLADCSLTGISAFWGD